MLEFVGLRGKENAIASSLSYGDQRRLEIARAMASDPKVLLLDEPAAGTNPLGEAGAGPADPARSTPSSASASC